MAQKRRAAARTQSTSGGQERTGRQNRNRRGRTARSAGAGEQRGRVAGNYQLRESSGARRLLAEARDMAQSVGETTIGAARDLAGGVAAGARGAAVGVARGTKGAATGVVDKVRDNPWPAMLIGAGATWMIVDAARSGPERGRRRTSTGSAARGRGNRGEAGFGADALSAVADAGRSVVDAGRSVGGRVERFVRDNPLVAGAATLGLGVAVGLALPSSVAENELFGDAREAIVRRAKEAARGTVRNVGELARGVGRAAER